ncbi:Putative sensory transduction histidine kinase,phytochrome-like (modular protein) [Magnetospirillum gryphiswaldense MSR-1 v2]|uniref:histidine kinase n=1 Tax=Magnetospirillum gryphiswaldense (strain DSM 6361 / JCM 21280 / NBRC 15271 / MSR-1) TaxID=431944 RepID=V6F941_MAGGM|nr:CHASE domain-containing protein [Magnetospirillum gryphiswaldense]CDL01336.1 Putative sensory transduction histidine kinase,phytochrome-like (modular protein) [Magnetospirillum gryphiswaldense MSR-1 v2]
MSTLRLKFLPWLVLFAALGVTWVVWGHERQAVRQQLRTQVDFSLRDVASRIEQRIATYELMLRGVQGMYATADISQRDMLAGYVASLQSDANFSAVQAIGVVELIPADRKDAHQRAMRQLGMADYAIFPEGQRDVYGPIVQREPNIGLNRAPAGFDAWSDPVRRAAMEKARDSGMVVMSGKLKLAVDAGQESQPGFIMYIPIFVRGQSHESVAERRNALTGWVFASFRIKDVMASLYGELPPGVAFTIFDGVDLSAEGVLYKSPNSGEVSLSAATANEYLVVTGHSWTLSARSLRSFEAGFGRKAESLIAGGGVGLSLLLSLLVWLMATGRARAIQLAESMTKDLRIAVQNTESAQRDLAVQAQSLAQSNTDLEQFAYVASHDLREPLRMVTMYLALVSRKLGPDLDADMKEFIGFAVDGAKRMDALILGLLEYARIARSEMPLQPLALGEPIAESLRNLQILCQEAGAVVSVAEDLPSILGDRTELIRLFQNLFANAVKYRSPDRAPIISVGWRDDGTEWCVWVKDNGIGIAPEYFEQVFGIFKRLVTRKEYEGTGIGLAICKRIVEHHLGRIWVMSIVGEGCTFLMAFPKIDAQKGH